MVFERPNYEHASSSQIGRIAGVSSNNYGNNTNAARAIFNYRAKNLSYGTGNNVKNHVDAPPPEDKS